MNSNTLRFGLVVVISLLISCESVGKGTEEAVFPQASIDADKLNSSVGNCIAPDGAQVDLEWARHISNKIIKTTRGSNKFFLRINKDFLEISTSGDFDAADGPTITLMPDFLYPDYTDYRPDVILNFVELDHKDYIFWKESFVHRSYQQGLIYFDGEDLQHICLGDAGVSYRW